MDKEHTPQAYKRINLAIATTWMDLHGIMLKEVRESEKDKCIISLICGI